MSRSFEPYSHYRLDLEQQGKRAKELLKANPALELADAQRVMARELRFDDWAAMKRHIARLSSERAVAASGGVLDADEPTLHIRCGSDLRVPLRDAGFHGDFHEHDYPYSIGPVHEGPGVLAERARFLVESYGDDKEPPLEYTAVLASLERDEATLRNSARYARIVIWSEFDCYDQLVLVRLLAHYARHARPPKIELVNCGDFPGGMRFMGLGHLPPEALRILWSDRQPAGPAQLSLGLDAWQGLASDVPRGLARLVRSKSPDLPLLAPALHRHLRELPSTENGLSFTEQLALQLLAVEPASLERLFARMTYEVDPLPGQGDLQFRDRVLGMEVDAARVFTRSGKVGWSEVLSITELGRRVLAGEVDFRSLKPRPRWVGGLRIAAYAPDWRWNEATHDAYLR